MAVVASVLVLAPRGVDAAVEVVAFDMVGSASQNMTSHTNAFAGAFTSAGDGFEKYQRNVSPSIPFGVLDDSLVIFPADSLGIVKDGNTDVFFGVIDTENADNTGPVTATWVFDVSSATGPMSLSIDMGAMGDFEAADTEDFFTWTYSFDGGATQTAFASTVDEAGSFAYTLEGGGVFTLDDPMLVGGSILTDDLATFTAPLTGSGSSLTVVLTAQFDGGGEAAAFQNLMITTGEPDPEPAALVINEIDYDQEGTDAAEFIEIRNNEAGDVDLSDYSLQLVNGSTGALYATIELPPATLAAGDYFVVCGDAATVANCDLDATPDTNLIQNGAPDAVALTFDFDGSIVDTVSYEGDTAAPYTEGSGVGLIDDPTAGASGISRCPDGSDTNSNNFDFAAAPITPGAANDCAGVGPIDVCPLDVTHTIPQVQGPGDATPLDGSSVIVEGVVTADFQDTQAGFFMQDPVGDGDAATSDGIFVFSPADPEVELGDLVKVQGTATEFFGLTEIAAQAVSICGAGTVAETPVSLPFAEGATPEPFEGMLISFADLTVTDVFDLGRRGRVVLSSDGRLDIPTDVVEPGAPAVALQDLNNRNQITLGDADNDQNKADVPFLGPDGTLRDGRTIDSLTGVLSYTFGVYEVWPTADPEFTGNPRPAVPDPLGGDLVVGSFNVLNYFTTIDDGVNDARGADSPEELERQTAKLVASILASGADLAGLQELENNGPVAIGALVDALNAAGGPGTWDYVDDPAYPGGLESTNAIKVGIIYRSDLVTPVGASVADPDPVFGEDRPPVAQTFDFDGEVFTVVVNHFKSKGCSDAVGLDVDQGDGQGCYNFRRTNMAHQLLEFVDELSQVDPDVLVIGDFNSYDMEDPIQVLEDGLTDYTNWLDADDRYSFVFFGQAGQLDYAFGTDSMNSIVTGVDMWHINADEPPFLDYNTEFKDDQTAYYAPNQFRSSDHDVVLVGIEARSPMTLKQEAISDLAALLPTDRWYEDRLMNLAIQRLESSLDPRLWLDDSNLGVLGYQVFNAEKLALVFLAGVRGTDVSDVVDKIIRADMTIARTAIDRARDTGGDERKIAQAEMQMTEAGRLVAAGRYASAVDLYRRAWLHATEATGGARFATYNASMNRFNQGDLVAELSLPGSSQPATIAEIVQRTRPDVLLINEFDFDAAGQAADLFQRNYLGVSQNGAEPIEYPFRYVAPSNTGIPSGFDLDNNGSVGGPNDAFGFGFFPGQFGMAVFSKHPIDLDHIRTFQLFLWKDMPGALLPDDPATAAPADWYSPAELEAFRLSSKSHWDVPVVVGDDTVHFLTSHPTPPVFDGPEDRNGTRNHDEIRFWADYINPMRSSYIYDDDGRYGGLPARARFVIAGDQNSDPFDGDSIPGSAQQLTENSLINNQMVPTSEGAVEAAALQGGANDSHVGDPKFDTADFSDSAPGNLRVDYVLPSRNMTIVDGAVFWPTSDDPLFPLVGTFPFPSSDHKLVWLDLAFSWAESGVPPIRVR